MDPLDRDQVSKGLVFDFSNHQLCSFFQVNYALEMIDELHPISKTPLYVIYPVLRPLQKALNWLPWMNYVELVDEDHQMSDLLEGKDV